ncbi:hypothetical protein NP233_g12332 [Leucocoprinus birnbaumii]|uniref:Helitron helicase-like domain-containing protein n=1 Tax=Leucocoprinus birnbaumii TaxID=56174 RepID=A0AAD5VFB1_9AGAR|nr:hypothetical protein NP233_g12332 [Leucocoprinus birnbaumii]
MPGMFPTLFPYGIGGLEDSECGVPVSFQHHVCYLLNIKDKSFRYHFSFVFVALNILQRRTSHLHTHFRCKKSNFDDVARKLVEVSPKVLLELSERLQKEKCLPSHMSREQQEAMALIRQLETISAHIPGPIFMVMCGDSSIDLFSQFLVLPPAHERALMLAKDPVAAANFFEFAVRSMFEYLLGWDYENGASSEGGGIFGRVEAFAGTSEFTEWGCLHGHFLVWLARGLNPTDIYEWLESNPDYQTQFFKFWESIIHHHLPDIDVEIGPSYDPRLECPPVPPHPDLLDSVCTEKREPIMVPSGDRPKPAETFQEHGSRADLDERAPHNIEEVQAILDEWDSVFVTEVKKCGETLQRHECRTSPIEGARRLLHKCLSQFTHRQQIHAQQAVRYLQGFGDEILSHETTPMLSAILMSFVREKYRNILLSPAPSEDNSPTQHHSDHDDDGDDLPEETNLAIRTSRGGVLIDMTQVHHYWYRADTLSELCFFDFCQNVRLEAKARSSRVKNNHKSRLGVLRRHALKPGHPLSETHHLVEHTNIERGDRQKELVLRVVGMSIPRESNPIWPLFTLAHFKPFSDETPLLLMGRSVQDTYNAHNFSNSARLVTKNWNAVHESTVALGCMDEDIINLDGTHTNDGRESDFLALNVVESLAQARWFEKGTTATMSLHAEPGTGNNEHTKDDQGAQLSQLVLTSQQLKEWRAEIKAEESNLASRRCNALNPDTLGTGPDPASTGETEVYNPALVGNEPEPRPGETIAAIVSQPAVMSADEVVARVGEEFCLNEKQLKAFGSAAGNIDGMTIYKGLGIKITKKDGRGKATGKLEPAQKTIPFCGLQLLCDIDHALRYAKEQPEEWFGGITIIFAGDFYQYPPVGASPLYTPIASYAAQSNEELQKRLGCLAWKSVNVVVELTEQQRMKGDPEYAAAVQRLRTRACMQEDVDLFNTRIIKTNDNVDGVDMGITENFQATAIVNTNWLQQILNLKKAQSVGGDALITCAARDTFPSAAVPPTRDECETLLKLDLSSSKIQQALPGFIPLFESMPVILKTRNISTELKITNGSQGYVRKIFTDRSDQGFIYCTCVIVEFPDSPIQLKGLPRSHFPITPVTFSFSYTLPRGNSGSKEVVQVVRNQLPVQPAFAVTGHSAQGKTLPRVLAALDEGGFAAYVAASRAREREGLCLLREVKLSDLNKPLPSDLFYEVRRLRALEHNTDVKYGYSASPLLDVPDQESQRGIKTEQIKDRVEYHDSAMNSGGSKSNGKRKYVEVGDPSDSPARPVKRNRPAGQVAGGTGASVADRAHSRVSQLFGCRWSSANWSCAYDATFMGLYLTFVNLTPEDRNSFEGVSEAGRILGNLFTEIELAERPSSELFDLHRNAFRNHLQGLDARSFPRTGQVCTTVSGIMEMVVPLRHRYCQPVPRCSNNCQFRSRQVTVPDMLRASQASQASVDNIVQTWMCEHYPDMFTLATFPSVNHMICSIVEMDLDPDIPSHSSTPVPQHFPILVFELHSTESYILPSTSLQLPCRDVTCRYRLSAIVYHGSLHFTLRIVLPDGAVWKYDGQANNGSPEFEKTLAVGSGASPSQFELSGLLDLDGRRAHVLIYSHDIDNGPH